MRAHGKEGCLALAPTHSAPGTPVLFLRIYHFVGDLRSQPPKACVKKVHSYIVTRWLKVVNVFKRRPRFTFLLTNIVACNGEARTRTRWHRES